MQSVRPVPHETTQAALEHTRPAGQAVPQAAQLFTSVCRSRQTPPQLVVPAPQDTWHMPPEQTWPAAQAMPQPPQPLEPVPTDLEGLAPIVVVSTTGDPATPYESGVRIAEQIPDARLVTNVGDTHTVVGQGRSCIDDLVTDYFVDLVVPEDGVRCG